MILSTHGILKPLTQLYSVNYGGGDEYSSVPAASINYANKTYTFNIWIKTTATTQQSIFSKGGTFATVGFDIQINAGDVSGKIIYTWNNGSSVSSISVSGTNINNGSWHKLTLVVTTSTTVTATNAALIYIDDTLQVTTDSKVSVYTESGSNTIFGARASGGGTFYVGYQYSASLWNTGLTLAEIQAITPTISYPLHSQYANLTSAWVAALTYPTITDIKSAFNSTMNNMESGDIQTDVP